MNSWLLFPTAVIFFLLILSQVNLYIDIHFCRRKDDDFLKVTVYALEKLLFYSIKIPAINIIQYNDLPWITSEIKTSHDRTKTHVEREQRFVKKLIKIFFCNPRRYLRFIRTAKNFFRTYRYYTNRLTKKMHCVKLDIKTIYGFEDAALTGVLMGVLGSIIGIMLNSLHNRLVLDTKPEIKLIPVYGRNHLEIEIRCIFRIRLGNVITATMARLPNTLHREATRSG